METLWRAVRGLGGQDSELGLLEYRSVRKVVKGGMDGRQLAASKCHIIDN